MPNDTDDPPTEPEGTVLSPEELDITEDQHVVELDDGRFLISPGEEADPTAASEERATVPDPTDSEEVSAEDVHRWLTRRLEAADSRYGFDITAVFEGTVRHQELFSNDVITTFENLLVWYAQHVGGDTPVEDVLGILLAESRTPIRLPPNVFDTILAEYGLDGDASVAELREGVRRDGGLRVPPSEGGR